MQFIEVILDPTEAAVAEAGGMMYMDPGIEMETIFGDGSGQGGGILGALPGGGAIRYFSALQGAGRTHAAQRGAVV